MTLPIQAEIERLLFKESQKVPRTALDNIAAVRIQHVVESRRADIERQRRRYEILRAERA